MKIFSYLYTKTLSWSSHRHAPRYLATVSFAESSFFPIPPDVMLVSMGLAMPQKSWRFAFIATIFSVFGGLFGYVLGAFGFHLLEPYLMNSSYASSYLQIAHWFKEYGVWIILIAGFTPLPYKLFTITAGAMHMPLAPFVVASIVSRGLRFYLVSGLLFFAGERIEKHLRQYIDTLGWLVLLALMIGYIIIKWT